LMIWSAFNRDDIEYRPLTALWFVVRTLMRFESPIEMRMAAVREWVNDTSLIHPTEGLITLERFWYMYPSDYRARGLDKPDRPFDMAHLNWTLEHYNPDVWISPDSSHDAPESDPDLMTGVLPTADYCVKTGVAYESGYAAKVRDFIRCIIGSFARRREFRLPLFKFILGSGIVLPSELGADSILTFKGNRLMTTAFSYALSLGDQQPFMWAFDVMDMDKNMFIEVLFRNSLTQSLLRRHLYDRYKTKRRKMMRQLMRWLNSARPDGTHKLLFARCLDCTLDDEATLNPVTLEPEDGDDAVYRCTMSDWIDPEDTILALTSEDTLAASDPITPGICRWCHEHFSDGDDPLDPRACRGCFYHPPTPSVASDSAASASSASSSSSSSSA